MNLFCFSLEGSMDSLYEAVQSSSDGAPPPPIPSRSSSRSCSRSCSPALLLEENAKWRGSGRSISLEMPQQTQGTNSNKKKRRTHVSKSASDNEALDNPGRNAAAWQPARSQEDLAHITSSHNEEVRKTRHRAEAKGGKGAHHSGSKKKEKSSSNQSIHTSAVKRNPKTGKKSVGKNGKEGSKKSHSPRGECGPGPLCRKGQLARRSHPHSPAALEQPSTPPAKEWDGKHRSEMAQSDGPTQDRKPQIPPNVPRSATQVDLSEPNRSTSFGKFEGLRHHSSQAKSEENGTTTLREESDSPDPNKSAGLGKKMKEISLTMRRKMGKKHAKSFTEEAGDETDKDPEADTDGAPPAEKNPSKTSNSLESLCSGQSSSSGVTSESNDSGKRDSLRLEEDGSYQGQFCGRARVHTDFVPSPYDTDSLKLKVGDIINIISKPPMGIWTGMLHNKVGNFKFIYVDVLVEKEEAEEEEAPKIRPQKLCKRPRPKTLLELLERLNLEEYASALLLNGYQTVEDLLHLQEKHLIELNVKDPEHRRKLLAAADFRYTEASGDDVRDTEEHKPTQSPQEEDSDCPRDSGCFIPSECSDSKEETEQATEAVDS
ncbi:SAM domain-containing protein SAMSN-1a isoform 2-T2 [Menidia menidia]